MIEAAGIDQLWTSVKEHAGMVDRNELLLTLAATLRRNLERHAQVGFAAMKGEWESNHVWQGLKCTLSTGSQDCSGTVLGVDDQGGLRMMIDGGVRSFSGGELSLRLDQ